MPVSNISIFPNISTTFSVVLLLVLIVIIGLVVFLSYKTPIKKNNEKLILKYNQLIGLVSGADRFLSNGDYSKIRDIFLKLDIFLGDWLYYIGCKESTIAERLKSNLVKNLINREDQNKIWDLHKLRNKIAHEDYNPTAYDISLAHKFLIILKKHI